MIRHFIREQLENKQLIDLATEKINNLLDANLKFKQISEYQYLSEKNPVGSFLFLKDQSILMTFFRITENHYQITFQVYWTFNNEQKRFVCNLKSMTIKNGKVSWNKNKEIV